LISNRNCPICPKLMELPEMVMLSILYKERPPLLSYINIEVYKIYLLKIYDSLHSFFKIEYFSYDLE